ncbi:DUF4190 domain-containing protein [Isoptericola croceus]|uniref:DUF4190 domain-containing protein n=1 Tax=Isoptericola croceus TaxID=3031406 RepID=UPI0023F64A6F|nr:DUF4190 domain-containing protein [Isoptericola croceus]
MTSTSSPDPYRPGSGRDPATPPAGGDPYGTGSPQGTPPPYQSGSPYAAGQPSMPAPTGQSPYPAQQGQGTDGFSIAALVTGILGMALIAVGLGIAGLVRTKRSGRPGKGLAIAGIILGALSTIAWIAFIVFFVALVNSPEVRDGIERGFYSY